MKTIFKLILPAVLALVAAACALGVDDTETPAGRKHTTHFKVVTEESTTTKVYVGDALKSLWNAGDNITIFNNNTFNSKYQFAGDDGAVSGNINEVSTGSGNALRDDYVYAVYPYYSGMKIHYKTDSSGNFYYITTTLPTEQHYKANSFGVGANMMLAVTRVGDEVLSFKNVCGYLKLQLYGENVSVSRIKIKGNNGEKIAGAAYISNRYGYPDINLDYLKENEITLVCDSPVALGTTASAPTDFWFVIPPITFTKGFTMTVTDASGKVFERTSNSSLTVTRNTLEWMSPLEVVPTYDPAPMVVCTFNVRKVEPTDPYPWEVRKAAIKKFLDTVKPDLVGLQEIRMESSNWFSSYSDDYGYFDVSRDSQDGISVSAHGGNHEGIGVLYRKDRFDLVLSDFFWLDENPYVLPSGHLDSEGKTRYGSWDSGNRRITLIVVLKDKRHENSFVYFFPTHYDNYSEEARRKGAELMVSQMKSLCNVDDLKGADVVFFHVGDLNTPSDGGLIDILNDNLYYARTFAGGSDVNTETNNRFGTGRGSIIDHIYYGGKSVKPVRYWVDRTVYEGVQFISDHYPVLFQWEYYPPTNSE